MLFSIVLVNFNGGAYLEECFRSLRNQNRKLFQLIFVDGGSTDNSVEISKNYSDLIDVFISEPDEGQSDAINKGFSFASGDYFFWLNSDDILLPKSLSLLGDQILRSDALWFSVGTVFIDSKSDILKVRSAHAKKLITRDGLVNVGGPSAIVKRTLFQRAGGLDINLKYSMDTDLWCRIASEHGLPLCLNGLMWGFRVHNASKTSGSHFGKTHPNHFREYLLLKERHGKVLRSFVSRFNIISKLLYLMNCLILTLKLRSNPEKVKLS